MKNTSRKQENRLPTRLLGVVVCGGRSTRMGIDKSTLLHASGLTYLQHTTIRLQECCETVIHSVAHHSSSNFGSNEVVRDRIENRGPAEGIAVALQFASKHQFNGCLVNAVDLPNLHSDDLYLLIDAFALDQHSITVATDSSDRLQPLVAIYPAHAWEEIDGVASSSNRSLVKYLERQPIRRVVISDNSLHNVNAPNER